MALITCPECKKEISNKAKTCPNCGAPVKKNQEVGCCSGCFIIFIAIFIFGKLFNSSPSNTVPNNTPVRSPSVQSEPKINLPPDVSAINDAKHLLQTAPTAKWSLEGKLGKYQEMQNRIKSIATYTVIENKTILASYSIEIASACKQLEKDIAKERLEKKKREEERKKEIEQLKKKHSALLKKFRINEDKLEHVKFYTHTTFPVYTNSRNVLYPYIAMGTDSGYTPVIRTVFGYTGSNWIFVQKVSVYIANNKVFEKDYGFFKWQRENNTNGLWERLDVKEDDLNNIYTRIANTKNSVDVRFEGKDYRKDFKIGPNDKQAIKDTIDLYEALKNNPSLAK